LRIKAGCHLLAGQAVKFVTKGSDPLAFEEVVHLCVA
jgi:hypothetical protein